MGIAWYFIYYTSSFSLNDIKFLQMSLSDTLASGNEFQTDGPATATDKARRAKGTQSVARYVQKLSAGASETLPRCDCGEWDAEVGQVLGCLAFQTAVYHVR